MAVADDEDIPWAHGKWIINLLKFLEVKIFILIHIIFFPHQ